MTEKAPPWVAQSQEAEALKPSQDEIKAHMKRLAALELEHNAALEKAKTATEEAVLLGRAGRLWLSVRDLADRYGVSDVSIWRWTKARRLPQPHRIGPNCVRYCANEVREHEQRLRGAA